MYNTKIKAIFKGVPKVKLGYKLEGGRGNGKYFNPLIHKYKIVDGFAIREMEEEEDK